MRYKRQRKSFPAFAYLLFFLPLLLISSSKSTAQDFKVVGYLPSYRFHLNDKIEYHKMTHICLSFANPDSEGRLSFDKNENPRPIIANAKAAGTKVFLSLAGGGLTEDWKRNWKKLLQPYYRTDFIQSIVNYTLAHRFDGVDVDLEWGMVNEFYSDFVVELGQVLKVHGIKMTAALPGIHRYPAITDQALRSFDWINLMAYDLTGPWKPSASGQHAPFSLAKRSIDYWKAEGLPTSKMTLGLPFYGFDFSNKKKTKVAAFGDIVKQNVHLARRDRFSQTYYNGIPTIQEKTDYALREVAGVMVWEIGQDSFDDYSLLNTIYERCEQRMYVEQEALLAKNDDVQEEVKTSAAPIAEEPFPEFAEPIVYDSWEVRPTNARLILLDFFGKELCAKSIEGEESWTINTGFFLNGWSLFERVIEEQKENSMMEVDIISAKKEP